MVSATDRGLATGSQETAPVGCDGRSVVSCPAIDGAMFERTDGLVQTATGGTPYSQGRTHGDGGPDGRTGGGLLATGSAVRRGHLRGNTTRTATAGRAQYATIGN